MEKEARVVVSNGVLGTGGRELGFFLALPSKSSKSKTLSLPCLPSRGSVRVLLLLYLDKSG